MVASRHAEALRLLGWAKFNLGKGKIEATETLLDKAIKVLEEDEGSVRGIGEFRDRYFPEDDRAS